MDNASILQRTDIGLETIKTKSIRLTQSERLVLIIVDGVTPYHALREKVWALSTERYMRAMNTLLEKNLIFEVLLPDENQQREELDSAIVDRFLEQDTLDPVTIISLDPEDHFGSDLVAEMGNPLLSQPRKPASAVQAGSPESICGVRSQALSPVATVNPQARPFPSLTLQLDPGLAKTMKADCAASENKSPIEIATASAAVHLPDADRAARPAANPSLSTVHIESTDSLKSDTDPKAPPPAHSRHSKAESRLDRDPAEKSGSAQAPLPGTSIPEKKKALAKTTVGPASRSGTNPHHHIARTGSSRTWSENLLKLCCWSSVISGLVIFMFLIFRYYGTVA
jgi:hypothetical protein